MPARSCQLVVAVVIACALGARASADTHLVLRTGVAPLALAPGADTPLLGGFFDDAVNAYNAAALAYDRAHGYAASSSMATQPIDRSALGVKDTLYTFAPGLEIGGDTARFRLEAVIAIGDTHHAFGVGAYPIDLAWPMGRSGVAPYVVVGGTACWLDRTDTEAATVGALVAARAAAGVRLGRHVAIELGYDAFVLGGVVDGEQLHSMMHYDPSGAAPPPAPDRAVSGGEQRGMIDVAVGVTM